VELASGDPHGDGIVFVRPWRAGLPLGAGANVAMYAKHVQVLDEP
jgi:hypothetical protein